VSDIHEEPNEVREPSEPAGKSAAEARQFPDLFQKALQGSHLADNISVKYDGEDERNELRPVSGSMTTMTPGRTPVGVSTGDLAGATGVTFGAPAPAPGKRRWRKGR
jgi:hypothetical protein